MKKIIAILLFTITFTLGCERDDLCPADTQTTPRLIIDFLDVSDLESSKNVATLVVKGVGNDSILEGYSAVTSSQAILPLKTTEDSTQFSLYKDGVIDDDGIITGDEDIITITYTREQVYVSRACGYKTIFKGLNITLESVSDNWIQIIQPLNDNQSVEDETATHFKIFH